MEWIKIDVDLKHHPKTKRLARRLGASIPETMGYLFGFWSWVFRHAPNGDISNYEAWEIADAASYDGDADVFITAMHEAKFIDDDNNVHEWMDFNGALYEYRQKEKERLKAYRQRTSSVRVRNEYDTSNVHINNEYDTSTEQVEYTERTESVRGKSKSESKTLVCSETSNTRQRHEYPEEFEVFWATYPRNINKVGAYKAWDRCLKAGAKREDIQTAAEHYAESCRQKNTEAQFMMHPSTFLGRDQRWTEYVKGIPKEAMSSYDRAIADGPQLTGIWGKAFGHVKEVELEEAIDIDGAGLDGLRGADTRSRRGDEGEPVPF